MTESRIYEREKQKVSSEILVALFFISFRCSRDMLEQKRERNGNTISANINEE